MGSLVEFYADAHADGTSIQWSRTYGNIVRFKGFLGVSLFEFRTKPLADTSE